MQEYSDIETSKIYSYFKLCIDSIKDRLDLDIYNLGVILSHGPTITCVVKCYKKPPRGEGHWLQWNFHRDYAFPSKYYCMLDTRRDNITVKDLSDGKTLFKGKTGIETSFSDYVYGKVRKGILKIPSKL